MASTSDNVPWYLRTSYPVEFPSHDALRFSQEDFDAFLRKELTQNRATSDAPQETSEQTTSESFTQIPLSEYTQDDSNKLGVVSVPDTTTTAASTDVVTDQDPQGQLPPNMENRVFTENGDLAYASTTNPLVDLFTELEEVITGPRLRELLQSAWAHDASATLKIIFNARSIHLGKSSRSVFYRCVGWLAQNHPVTLVANLPWVSRPIIAKPKPKKKKEQDEDGVDKEKDDDAEGEYEEEEPIIDGDDPSRYDVRNGLSHGYWKDLLNVLALAANDKLTVISDPRTVLNMENYTISVSKAFARKDINKADEIKHRRRGAVASKRKRANNSESDNPEDDDDDDEPSQREIPGGANWKDKKRDVRNARHASAMESFTTKPLYRALHLSIARLFAAQLTEDISSLDDPHANISLCGKWAPSQNGFHDRHTFIISSIAETMYPPSTFPPSPSREIYLRHARERYRRDISRLRSRLSVVERDLTARTYSDITYKQVPSIAMNRYSRIFIAKDMDRFNSYIEDVAAGKTRISGAALLPSTLVHQAYATASFSMAYEQTEKELLRQKTHELQKKVVDEQWNTLVRRVADSGTLPSSMAICDTSSSMLSPTFPDGTTPLHSAIGLSLLVASVAEPPFASKIITFSANPYLERFDRTNSLYSMSRQMESTRWGNNTDFVAVFRDLILPLAVRNQVKPDNMVKRIFVFSDMHFDNANSSGWKWDASYGYIKRLYAKHRYRVPEMVFWNLAGGRNGALALPATMADKGVSFVSGYSQGMLKVFLDGGEFSKVEDAKDKPEPGTMDMLRAVKKAIGHRAYQMLEVMD